MSDPLSVDELKKQCVLETKHFHSTGKSVNKHCYELFQRAFIEQDADAQEVIYEHYKPYVKQWIKRGSEEYIKIDDIDDLVQGVFLRILKYLTPKKATNFSTLAGYLKYLKLCVKSEVNEQLSTSQTISLQEILDIPDEVSETTIEKIIKDELIGILKDDLRNDNEKLVYRERWKMGFTSKEIQIRHKEKFSTPESVYQIKRNLLKRWKRHPKIKSMAQK